MCAIFQLRPGYTLPFNMLRNSVYNNPHGYGIIIKKDKKLKVIKELPPEGNDPNKIYEILKKNEDAERFVHVRWKTQGDISESNLHPFQVFKHKGREIWFMHNGTLHQYNPPYVHAMSQAPVNEPTRSDSRKFAEVVLEPILQKVLGANGLGDYNDEVVQEIIEKYWSTGNKGLLIGTDLDPYFLGFPSWSTIKTSEIVNEEEVTGEFFASNNDYFTELKRGPIYDQIKAAREKEEQERRQAAARANPTRTSVPSNVQELSSPAWLERFSLTEEIVDILEDYDMFSPEGYIALSNLTLYELQALVEKSPEGAATMLLYLTDFLRKATEDLIQSEEKHTKATKIIATLQHQIGMLQVEVEKLKQENRQNA